MLARTPYLYRQSIECTQVPVNLVVLFWTESLSYIFIHYDLYVRHIIFPIWPCCQKQNRLSIIHHREKGCFFFVFFIFIDENEYKNQVFIYGLPAGGDSLTSQSLARRKYLLMGLSLSLYRSVLNYYCISFFFLSIWPKNSSLSSSFNYFSPSSHFSLFKLLYPSSFFSFLVGRRLPAKYCWHVSTTDRVLGWRAVF